MKGIKNLNFELTEDEYLIAILYKNTHNKPTWREMLLDYINIKEAEDKANMNNDERLDYLIRHGAEALHLGKMQEERSKYDISEEEKHYGWEEEIDYYDDLAAEVEEINREFKRDFEATENMDLALVYGYDLGYFSKKE